MSFPNIPDVNPSIGITLEDAIHLLLASIAMEECSVSKLMDAESCKILCVLQKYLQEHISLQSLLDVNQSASHTIQDLVKLEMLLQFKLRDVLQIMSSSTTSSTTTTTTTTTSTTTTCSSSATASTTTSCPCCHCDCCVTGNANGEVSNPCDAFYQQFANLYTFVFSYDIPNSAIQYSTQNNSDRLQVYASKYHLEVDCSDPCHDTIIISGQARCKFYTACNYEITDVVPFILTVHHDNEEDITFRMQLFSQKHPQLCHDSGLVCVKKAVSSLNLEICYS